MTNGTIGLLQTLAATLDSEPGGKKWPTNPPDLTLVDPRKQDMDFRKALKGIIKGKYRGLHVAVIDFKADPLRYAYWYPDASSHIGSMAKLAILYAAFQMREDINDLIRAKPRISKNELTGALLMDWKNSSLPYLRQIHKKVKYIALDKIFDLDKLGTGSINFKGIEHCGLSGLSEVLSDDKKKIMNHLQELPHSSDTPKNWREMENLSFGERLWMSTAWSDNVAAASCIIDLTLPYIQALLYESKLFDRQRDGLYFKRNYIRNPKWDKKPPRLRFEPTYEMKEWQPKGGSSLRGTAYKMTALMTALVKNQLISEQASQEMKKLLRPVWLYPFPGNKENPIGVPPRILIAIREAGNPLIDDAIMKGGLWYNTHYEIVADWAYFEIGQNNTKKYGLIILHAEGGGEGQARPLLSDFAKIAWDTFRDL